MIGVAADTITRRVQETNIPLKEQSTDVFRLAWLPWAARCNRIARVMSRQAQQSW